MSWDEYVARLKAFPGVTHGELYGLDGNPWTKCNNLQIGAAEMKALIDAVKNKNFSSGAVINGVKFLVREHAGDSGSGAADLMGLTKRGCAISVVLSNTVAVVAARFDDAATSLSSEIPVQLYTAASHYRDYLAKTGY